MRIALTILGVILALMLIYWLLSLLLGALFSAFVVLALVAIVTGIVRYLWQKQQTSPGAQAKRERQIDRQAEAELRRLERTQR